MSQFYVPGPTRISVGQNPSGSLSFLGWATDGVTIAVQPRFDDIMTDLSGPAVPEEIQFLGADAVIRFTLARYNESVLSRIRSFLYGSTEGTWGSCTVGTLLKYETKAFRLFLRSPCASKVGQTDQRGVWNFRLAYPADAIEMNLSTRATRPRLTFRAIADIQSVDGSAILYDSVASGEPTYTL